MDRETRREFEELRRESGPVENQVIDDLLDGELDRKEFLQRGAMFGLTASALSVALAAAGETPVAFAKQSAKPRRGGRLRVGIVPPSGPIEPHMMTSGSGNIPGICGEYLIRAKPNLKLESQLAVGWKPNADASVWRVKLRQHVKFQNGETMDADDVIATLKRLTDPKSGSQAISAFRGVLTPDGIRRGRNAYEVVFALQAPNSSFPYILSSTTRQAIILPASYQLGTFVSKPQTTGAFRLTSYTPGVKASYSRYRGWWGGQAYLDGVDAIIYSDPAAASVALLSGSIDALTDATLGANRPIFGHKNIHILRGGSSAHAEIPMRVDQPPFNDVRVRQAIALTIDRKALVNTLYGKYADVGNDNPFAPVFPSTVKIKQRVKNLRKARQLLAAAGRRSGFDITLTAEETNVFPQMAQILQASARPIGVNIRIQLEPDSVYFAGTPSTTHWLNNPMTLTGWGSRAVPNVFLTSAFMTGGNWNAAHYSNKRYDALAKSFDGAIALKDQRKYAVKIEQLLQRDTPVIFPAFTQILAAARSRVVGFEPVTSAIYVSRVWLKR